MKPIITLISYDFGHKIFFDLDIDRWRYCDNLTLAGARRKCPRCEQYQTIKGHDPCSKNIKNAISVCCGHGIEKPILMLKK